MQATPIAAQAKTTTLVETANQKYVEAVYLNLLDRPVDVPGLKSWGAALDAKRPRSALVNAIIHTTEYYNNLVTAAYEQYLGRAPSANEATPFVNQFLQGKLTDEQLEANVLSLPEYISAHGGSANSTWVTSVYQNLLNRAPTPTELSTQIAALGGGKTAFAVALGLAKSPEHEGIIIRSDYMSLFGRAATQAEVNAWVNAFTAGSYTNEAILALFVTTDKYFQLHTM